MKNPFGVSFRGAAGDEESRRAFVFGARFLAALGMTAWREVLQQRAGLSVCVLAVLLIPSPGWAQVAGTVSGSVEDASGAPVSGAAVTVKSLETGVTRVVTTNQAGAYTALSLPVGPVEVKAEKEGFKTTVRTGINLIVGQRAVVNLRLELGEVKQEVTVTGGSLLVNTSVTPLSGVVGESEIKELPLNGRSFDNLLTLNTGTINFSALKSAQTVTSNGNTFSVEGRRTYENLFLLNGIEYTGTSQLAISPGGVSGQLLGIDAVREFNVLAGTYPAEYGRRAGAQVAIVTQSGSNTLHGSLFEFARNSALDARNFFDQGFVPPFRRNQFGGALGGPLKPEKLFLFGNYEGFRQSLAVSDVSVVPDQLARQGSLPNASGAYAPVPGLDAAMLPYMSFWPQPNGAELLVKGQPSGTALAYYNPRQAIREDFGTLRADSPIRGRDSVSAAYTLDDGNSLTPLADPLFGSALALRSQVASFQETHIFTPQLLNVFLAGFSRAGFNFEPFSFAVFPPSLSFVSGRGPGGMVIGGGLTTTGAAAITSAGPNNAARAWNGRNLFTYSDDVHIVKGAHQLGLGVWLQRIEDNEDSASRQLGQASFTSLETFLEGTVSSFQAVPTPTELGWRSLFGAWYFEDTIKLRPNLTVEAGLRDEFTSGWNEVSGRAANYLVDANGALETNPRVAGSAFTENNAKSLLGPRIAAAWDPTGRGTTAMRGAFGIHYSLLDDLSYLLNALPPYNGSVSFSHVSLSSIVPILPNVPPRPSCGPGVAAPCAIYAPQGVQANAKIPTVEEWSFSVERQAGSNTVLRAIYDGSFGYHGLLSVDPNTIPVEICSDPSGCQAGGVGAAKSAAAKGVQYIPVGSRPNPYLSSGFFWYTEGNSSYNALQLEIVRHLAQGLQFRAGYTWAKNLDMNSALTGAQANNQAQMVLDRNRPGRDWGRSALNITNQVSISAHYDFPFGRNRRGQGNVRSLGNLLIRGWQANGIATLLSGFPFTPQAGSNISGDGDTRNPDRPEVNPSFVGPILLQHPAQWFNPYAFNLPAAGTYGNLGRGTLNGPGLAEVDLSLAKDSAVTEKVKLQFRAEFFNILNRTNFDTPNPIVFSNGAVSSTAALITATATTSRQIQFGLKLLF